MIKSRLELVDLQQLKEHEETDPEHLRKTLAAIECDGILKNPLVADCKTLVVLDGVHRLNALRQKRWRVAPVCLVEYMSDEIVVFSVDCKTVIHKEDVIRAAFSGRKFPPRTTWHMIKTDDGHLEHISLIETEVHFPLGALAAGQRMDE